MTVQTSPRDLKQSPGARQPGPGAPPSTQRRALRAPGTDVQSLNTAARPAVPLSGHSAAPSRVGEPAGRPPALQPCGPGRGLPPAGGPAAAAPAPVRRRPGRSTTPQRQLSYPEQPLPPILPQQNDLQRVIHHAHWEERYSIIEALGTTYSKPLMRQAQKLAACGQSARLWLDEQTHTVKTLITRCRNRMCPWCTHARTAKAKRQILAIMHTMKHPRTIVLTARSRHAPLAEQISTMRQAFAKLRRGKEWKRLVAGGIYAVEITWNPHAETWHPHLHLIVDGEYFPQARLAWLWKKATGDSDIVWVKNVDNPISQAMELAAYIGKPPKIKAMPGRALRDYAHATQGARMLQTFGKIKAPPVDDTDPNFTPPADSQTVSVARLRFLARRQNSTATDLVAFISLRWPIFLRYFHPAAPPTNDHPRQRTNEEIAKLDNAIRVLFEDLHRQQEDGALGVYDVWDAL